MRASLDALFPGQDPVLLDGAMGSSLRAMGWPPDQATVLANLDAPEMVSGVHLAFRSAGARVLLSNSFAALVCGDPRLFPALAAGMRLARKAAEGNALVAGCLATSLLGEQGERLGQVLSMLVEEGADLIVFETCNTLGDAECALEACARHAGKLPVVLCATATDGSHADHARVRAVISFTQAANDPRIVAGVNCSNGPAEVLRLATSCGGVPPWLKPNTGLGKARVPDEVMGAFARAAQAAGARFIGGCCGTTAATLRAMSGALKR